MELFWRQGYVATGVAQIQKELGILPGSFYFFFKSKEELLLAVLDRYMEMLHPVLRDPVSKTTSDPIDRIFALLAFYRRQLRASRFTLGCPIGNLALELGSRCRPARKKLNALFDAWRGMIESFLAEAEGRLPRGTAVKAISAFVLTTMEGAIMLARANQDIRQFDRAVAQLRNYFDLIEGRKQSTYRKTKKRSAR